MNFVSLILALHFATTTENSIFKMSKRDISFFLLASKARKSGTNILPTASVMVEAGGGAVRTSTFAVGPNIRAKQTQLFGNRIIPAASKSTISWTGAARKRKNSNSNLQNGKQHTQMTLQETLNAAQQENKENVLYKKNQAESNNNSNTFESCLSKETNANKIKPTTAIAQAWKKSAADVSCAIKNDNSMSDTLECDDDDDSDVVMMEEAEAIVVIQKSTSVLVGSTPIIPAEKKMSEAAKTPIRKQKAADVTASTAVGTTTTLQGTVNDDSCFHHEKNWNEFVVLSCNRALLATRVTASSTKYDTASYGPDWIIYHRNRENIFQPWQMALTGKTEEWRLEVMNAYWTGMVVHKATTATVLTAVNNFSRLISLWDKNELENPPMSKWALTAFVAYRLAFKAEERPDVLWEVTNYWSVFPKFQDLEFDRSERVVNTVREGEHFDVLLGCDVLVFLVFLGRMWVFLPFSSFPLFADRGRSHALVA